MSRWLSPLALALFALAAKAGEPPLVIQTTSLPAGEVNAAYSQTVQVSGGDSIYTWSLLSGNLPAGLNLNSMTGAITGSPTTQAQYTFTIQVMDSATNTTSQTYTNVTIYPQVTINYTPPLSGQFATLPNGAFGEPYSQALTTSGGNGTLTWRVVSDALPNNVTINSSTGVISGTPSPPNGFPPNTALQVNVEIGVTDGLGGSATQYFAFLVNPALSVSTTIVPAAVNNTPYTTTLTASGGSGTLTWSVPENQLPSVFSLNSATGVITGNPVLATTGTYPFTVTVNDSNGGSAQQTLSLAVDFPGKVITSNLLPGMAIVNIGATTDGAERYNSGQTIWYQPFNLNSPSQLLEYTVQPGTYTFRVIDPTDALGIFPHLTGGQFDSIFTSWTYNTPWVTAYLVFPSSAAINPTTNTVGQIFSGAENVPLTFTGGGAIQLAYNYAVNNGLYNELFVGERNNPSPVTQYTFPTEQTLIFAVPDYDLGDNNGGVSVLIAPLASQSLGVTSSALAAGQAGTPYGPVNIPGATGGSGVYQWEVSPTSPTQLPNGLTLLSSGTLQGEPLVMGTFSNIILRVTDPVSGFFAQANYSITIAAPVVPLTITTPSPLPDAQLNTPYLGTGFNLAANGGLGAYTWSMTNVGTASGLTMSPGGVLSGTITTPGTYTFNLTVQDTAGDQTTKLFSISVIGITTTVLPAGKLGESYTVNLAVTGAIGNVNWIVEGGLGSPPAGIFLSSSGTLTGIPTAIGAAMFTVKATDSLENISTQQLSLTINGATQISYGVLNGSPGGLVTVSSDGTQVTSLAPSVHGYDLALDAGGNFIVATAQSLVRVTPAGANSTISTPPTGSQWIAVAVDGIGNLIVADNSQHEIWRITPDGATVTAVATYPVTQAELEDVRVQVDIHGNYIVAEDNGGAAHLFSITPGGMVNAITLAGSPLPTGVGGLTFDQSGNYMLLDSTQGALFQITPAGNSILFATGVGRLGVARNPVTNNYVAGETNEVLDTTANGSTTTALSESENSLASPQAIVALTSDFITTVDATNPLAYFRLQGTSGESETNGYTYSLSATGATTSNPGAPVGEAGENDVVLNGASGDVTTSLSGGVNTAGSLMAWINLAALPSTGPEAFNYIVGESHQANDFDLQISNANVLGFYTTCCGDSLSYTPNPATLANQWHMVVATFDATAATRAIYWDGALVATGIDANQATYTNKPGVFEIGASSVFPNRFFNGGIGEAAVWNYALTPGQVYRMYASSAGNFGGFNSPAISSITPATTPTNSSATPITIAGSNLGNTSAIWLTPVSLNPQTTVVPATISDSGVMATIPPSLLMNGATVQVAAANAAGVPSNELPFTVVAPLQPVAITTSSLPPGDQGSAYSQTVSASGGSTNYSWSIVSQAAGLNLSINSSSGLLTGTPTSSNTDGGFNIQIMVTDTTTMLTASQTFTIVVYPPLLITTASLPNATQNQPYSTTIVASGGSGNYNWSVSNESDNISLSINSSGNLTGTPGFPNTNPGFPIQITVTDTATNESQSQTYDLIVSGPPPQPAGTTVYVLDEYGELTSVTGGMANEFAYICDDDCTTYDMTRDAKGDFILAMGSQGLQVVGPSGSLLSQISPSQVELPEGAVFSSVAVDSTGYYIVADIGLNQLYRISPDGHDITDIGAWTFPGVEDQVITNSTDAFVRIDSSGHYIVSTDYQGEDDNVSFQLFVVNPGTTGAVFTPLALTGETRPQSTSGLTFDANGNYVDVDWWNDVVYTIQPNGAATTLFTDPNEILCLPGGISRDPASGDFFLVDFYNNALYALTPNGSQLNLVAQNGFDSPVATIVADTVPSGAVDYVLTNPDDTDIVPVGGSGNTITCSACDNGIDFAADAAGNFIVATGDQLVKVTSASGSCPTGCTILNASENQYFFSVAVDNAGNYIVADNGDHKILRIVPGAENTGTIAASIPYTVNEPDDDEGSEDVVVRIDNSGYYVVVEDNDDGAPISIFRIAPSALGSTTGDNSAPPANPITLTALSPLSSIPVTYIGGLTFDPHGNYVITDDDTGEIYTVTPAGAFGVLFNNTNEAFSEPTGIYLDPVSGNYLVTDSDLGALFSMNQAGNQVNLIASNLPDADAVLSLPTSLTVTTLSLPGGMTGQAYSAIIEAEGGSGNYNWTSTALPAGLVLSASGVVSGTPTTNTPSSVAFTVTDTSNSRMATQTYSLTIGGVVSPPPTPTPVVQPLTITTGSLPNGNLNVGYGPVTLSASGGSGSYAWAVSGVPGLTVNSVTGVLSGIPTTPGANQILTVMVDDLVYNVTVQASFSITIAAPLSITTTSLPNGIQNQPYSAALAASGGSGHYSWAISGIAGLTVNSSTGAIGGSPTSGGTQTLTVTVTDTVATNSSVTQTYSVGIAFAPLVITGSPALGAFAPGASISAAFGANGGQPSYTWTASGSPSGLSVNPSSGQLTGTAPQQPGNYSFSLTVKDSENQAASSSVTLTFSVLGFTTGSTLPSGTTATAYSANINAVGGTPPYSFTASGVPPGLSLATSGFLSGTATSANTYNLIVQVKDFTGLAVSGSFTLTITTGDQPIQVTGGQLPNGLIGAGYSQTLEAEDGKPPYTWSILGGALPKGLSLSSSGTIAGTPTAAGPTTFTAQATDSSGGFASGVFTLMVNPQPLQITAASLPGAIEGANYPPQTINATGGVQPYTFTLTEGSLPPPMTFLNGQISGGIPTANGTFSLGVTVTDANGSTSSGSYSIDVEPPGTGILFSGGSVSFTLVANAATLPPPASVPVASSVSTPLSYTLSVSPAASWLDVSGAGTTPGAINFALDPSASSLAPSTYQTTVTVTCTTSGPCSGDTDTIPVSLVVTSPSPQLSLGTDLLSFSSNRSTAQTLSQLLNLQNVGGGTITIESVTAADPWITFGTIPTTLSAGQLIPVTVIANLAGLAPNYYTSTITVTSSAGSISVPVALLISTSATMTLSPAGSQFLAVAGNPPGNTAGSFLVSVSGSSTVTWTASVTPSIPWLTLNTTSGSSTSAGPGSVSFSINSAAAAALAAKPYYATIQVTASPDEVVDPTLTYEVVLNVSPAASAADPDPEPGGLIFIGASGPLPPQTVQVFASSTKSLTYNASASSTGNWLSVSPASGMASSGSPGQSSVSVNLLGLAPGIHSGSVNYSFSSEVRTVNVTLIIPKTPPAPAISGEEKPNTTPACAPSQIVPTATGLVNNFSLPTAWPTPLTIRLLDDCGAAITNGQVVATFTNGDPPLALGPVDSTSGDYSGTWTPRATASQLTISASATAPNLPAATIQIAGQVTRNAAPVLAQNGTFNAFVPVPGSPLAPGMIVQIYGSNLAAQVMSSATIPLATSLGNTSVIIGGIEAPLYYVSPGQINAQVPFGLTPGNAYQVIVSANSSLSTPDPIQLAQDSPGIAAFASGAIIAQHGNGDLVTDSSPAAPGEYIVFYVAGLGPTNTPVATGGPSPSSPLATPVDMPALTLNGTNVPIAFAGLTPTLVGLYQVNFQVPANTPNGDLQLVLTQTGGQSNMTILPVHN